MSVTITTTVAPATEEDLMAAEAAMHRLIPSDYRTFLLAHNGGHPQPCNFQMQGATVTDTGGCIRQFFAINSGTYMTDLVNIITKTYRDRVPDALFPIANDYGGNLICLGTAGAYAGGIYFWDHECEADEGEPPTYNNLYFLANSLGDLLASLFPHERA